MLNPKYERTETAACAGCTAAQILVGFAPDQEVGFLWRRYCF